MPFVLGFVVAFVVVRILLQLLGWVVGMTVAHPGRVVAAVCVLALWARLA